MHVKDSAIDDWTQAMGYDAENQQYETSIINGGSGIHSDQRAIYPGKGYWLWMNDPATLVPLRGTKDFHDLDYPQVGVEWVNAYQVTPLSTSNDTAIGFYNTLGNAGWVQMFEFGDNETQTSHFTAEGEDWQYIDGADVALFAGHGSPEWIGDYIRLPEPNLVLFNSCEWGDHDLEWIFLHGCHTTRYPENFKAWPYWTMNGVHLVCGFYSEGWDVDDGTRLANYLLEGQTIKNAWFNATDYTHGSGIILRVIGENEACGNDHIWGSGSVISDPPVDANAYDEWWHYCD